uniref:DH domain-containing protein n=1 Tax=Steinernema glaseri TaxID=37863 RepID=A0A1I7Z2R3_9BILA
MLENKLFAKAVEVQQRKLGHSLPVASYLLKPVQRVLKYHLFWEKIMKQWNRPPALTLEEKFYVRKAFESMTQLAENINSEKKRCDRIERVVQLQSRIINFPLDEIPMPNQGELLLDGSLKMLNSKSRRYLFLYERVFLLTKEQNGYFLCKGCIPTANMMINDTVPNHPMAFEIISFGVTSSRHSFDAESINVKQQWVKEVKRIMFDHCAVKITRPNFRGYSFGGAMGLPKSRPISTVSEVNIGSKPEVSPLPKKTYSFAPPKRKEHRHIRFENSAPGRLETPEQFVSGKAFERMLDERYANLEEEENPDFVAQYWVSSPHLKTGYRRSRSSLVAEQIRRKKLEKANRDI